MTNLNKLIEQQKERARECLRPKVTIRPEDTARFGNAQHILQTALDEWYRDFEPALDTLITQTHQATIAEVVRIAEGMKKSLWTRDMPPTSEKEWYNQALIDLIETITKPKTDQNDSDN